MRRERPEVYVSCDVETNGPIPGPYSMLSVGCAAFDEEGKMIDTFSANLEYLPGASNGHPDTMSWWSKQPEEAWQAHRRDTQEPADAMADLAEWLGDLPGKPVFVGYPAGFDFTFVHWYMVNFTGDDPFGFSALDMKSFAMALLGTGFRETVKKNMPREWFSRSPHTHVALDDAIEQGELFVNMLRWGKARK